MSQSIQRSEDRGSGTAAFGASRPVWSLEAMTGFNQVSASLLRVERSGLGVRNGLPFVEMIEFFELRV